MLVRKHQRLHIRASLAQQSCPLSYSLPADLGAAAADAWDVREAAQLLVQAVPGVTLR